MDPTTAPPTDVTTTTGAGWTTDLEGAGLGPPETVRVWLQLQDEGAELKPGEQPRTRLDLCNVVLPRRMAAAMLRQLAEELDPRRPVHRVMAGDGTVLRELEDVELPAAGGLPPAPQRRDPLDLDQRAQLDSRSSADLDADDRRRGMGRS